MKIDSFTAISILLVSVILANPDCAAQQYETQIRPILAKHCFPCHGSNKQESEIRFDTLSTDFLKNRSAAETWHDALNSLDLGEMPPDEQPKLSLTEHEALTTWIRNR
ncbi:MAG: c-type cytochrome domain-containing protein, partial [Mariniblastus sp.]